MSHLTNPQPTTSQHSASNSSQLPRPPPPNPKIHLARNRAPSSPKVSFIAAQAHHPQTTTSKKISTHTLSNKRKSPGILWTWSRKKRKWNNSIYYRNSALQWRRHNPNLTNRSSSQVKTTASPHLTNRLLKNSCPPSPKPKPSNWSNTPGPCSSREMRPLTADRSPPQGSQSKNWIASRAGKLFTTTSA